MKKILERFRNSVTLIQGILICVVLFMASTLAFSVACTKTEVADATIHIIAGAILIIFEIVFLFILFDKTAENVVYEARIVALKELRTILTEEYKIVDFPYVKNTDISELFEQVLSRGNYKLYAKIDEDNNICYAIMNEKMEIVAEKKTKKYRFFFENFHVY